MMQSSKSGYSKKSNHKSRKKAKETEGTTIESTTRIVHADALGPSLPPLEIMYTNNVESIQSWLRMHAQKTTSIQKAAIKSSEDEEIVFLGFDTETKPSFTRAAAMASRGPDTIQLAKSDGNCLVAHISHMKRGGRKQSHVDNAFMGILEHEAIVKAGVSIDHDALELYKNYGLATNCRMELGYLDVELDGEAINNAKKDSNAAAATKSTNNNESTNNNNKRGLKALCEHFVPGMVLTKKKKLQMSNWSLSLSDDQVAYAAADAFAGAALCQVWLLRQGKNDRAKKNGHAEKQLVKEILGNEIAAQNLEAERQRRKRERQERIEQSKKRKITAPQAPNRKRKRRSKMRQSGHRAR